MAACADAASVLQHGCKSGTVRWRPSNAKRNSGSKPPTSRSQMHKCLSPDQFLRKHITSPRSSKSVSHLDCEQNLSWCSEYSLTETIPHLRASYRRCQVVVILHHNNVREVMAEATYLCFVRWHYCEGGRASGVLHVLNSRPRDRLFPGGVLALCPARSRRPLWEVHLRQFLS